MPLLFAVPALTSKNCMTSKEKSTGRCLISFTVFTVTVFKAVSFVTCSLLSLFADGKNVSFLPIVRKIS